MSLRRRRRRCAQVSDLEVVEQRLLLARPQLEEVRAALKRFEWLDSAIEAYLLDGAGAEVDDVNVSDLLVAVDVVEKTHPLARLSVFASLYRLGWGMHIRPSGPKTTAPRPSLVDRLCQDFEWYLAKPGRHIHRISFDQPTPPGGHIISVDQLLHRLGLSGFEQLPQFHWNARLALRRLGWVRGPFGLSIIYLRPQASASTPARASDRSSQRHDAGAQTRERATTTAIDPRARGGAERSTQRRNGARPRPVM